MNETCMNETNHKKNYKKKQAVLFRLPLTSS
jgi:hypothetical protein